MGNFNRQSFNNRGSNRPVVMHQATCDRCGKDCEVPFRPTNGKPIFCSSCFENNRGSDSRRFEGRNSERPANFNDRQMFDAVCDNCGNSCKVPFRPSSGKPVYCSNCFGNKKEGGNRNEFAERPLLHSREEYKEQFEQLNNKLDKILVMLTPNAFAQAVYKGAEEQTVNAEEKTKATKKKPSKKK